MSTTQSNLSKIAVIGVGNIGTVIAENLVKGNRQVIIADRKIEKVEKLSQRLGDLALPMEIPAANQKNFPDRDHQNSLRWSITIVIDGHMGF